jgi:feruloyl esterase
MRALLLVPFAILLASLPLAAAQVGTREPCDALTKLSLPEVTFTSATAVAAGPFTVPGSTRSINAPQFCRVIATVWPEVNFEVWLPAQWNRKFVGVGNGGQAGTISYGAMVAPLLDGYAVASTDTGHKASEAAWALNHFQRIIDYGYRGTHVMTQAAKAITTAHYGRTPEHSYFDGCSNGGRQALMEAQRYPGDYDGIIAGDPAADWTHLYTGGHLWAMRVLDGDGYFPASKVPMLARAVNKACDDLDGISDGILNDPRRCHFDPAVLKCKDADAPNCFTHAQIAAIRRIWDGARLASGDLIQPGLMPGGEDGPGGWSQWLNGTGPGTGGHAGLGKPGFQYMVFDDPAWDFRKFRYEPAKGFDSDVDFVDHKLAAIMNSTDPDLRAFQARGGKLIQYHGWSDPDISPLTSIQYYEKVAQVVGHGAAQNRSMEATGEFFRLFMVPGMQHCQGGPGPSSFDRLNALEQWVEKGRAPERIVASHVSNGQVDRTRPLCAYPKQAIYDGTGSTDDAANFSCALPVVP